ncbi:tripartite tricarboxylate transporter substrate binding protein [Diaphorobacter sp. HDW4A]|uniref:Bug family tripartite tricarboxylate transporter substrate binding protein n=1 Tax=Diaphorobacter sp. HDW4A TaxID=2714924 RepID=UPI00140DA85A|nr:tripartite tricarboxylate transporter substrate binding protein [Diaphorobacter sp. HDW4A]QIL79804.1 tripartite tricarboxylate transporter substrate binding protein [Diaphorobacter sp. HDW4A]
MLQHIEFSRPLRRVLGLTLLLATGMAGAQDPYPNRPITLISPFSAGGDADLAARTYAAAATKALGQSVVVMNKTGASGVIGSAQVVAAKPDGYTLLLARTGSQAIMPAIMPTSTKYKWNDYTFIGMLELNPYGCVVSNNSPYKTFSDLTDAMKKQGKNLNFGTAGVLTTNDMGPRQLFRMLKLTDQIPTQLPYKGTGEAVTSLLAGQTQFSCGSLGTFLAHIKSGSLRALMVTTAERLNELPQVPTARELGFAEMEQVVGWSAVFAPAQLPANVKDRLVAAMTTIAEDPQWRTMTAQTGSLPYIRSPEQTREFVQKQYELYRSLGESLNIIDASN